jgi:hypothetical protein
VFVIAVTIAVLSENNSPKGIENIFNPPLVKERIYELHIVDI